MSGLPALQPKPVADPVLSLVSWNPHYVVNGFLLVTGNHILLPEHNIDNSGIFQTTEIQKTK